MSYGLIACGLFIYPRDLPCCLLRAPARMILLRQRAALPATAFSFPVIPIPSVLCLPTLTPLLFSVATAPTSTTSDAIILSWRRATNMAACLAHMLREPSGCKWKAWARRDGRKRRETNEQRAPGRAGEYLLCQFISRFAFQFLFPVPSRRRRTRLAGEQHRTILLLCPLPHSSYHHLCGGLCVSPHLHCDSWSKQWRVNTFPALPSNSSL